MKPSNRICPLVRGAHARNARAPSSSSAAPSVRSPVKPGGVPPPYRRHGRVPDARSSLREIGAVRMWSVDRIAPSGAIGFPGFDLERRRAICSPRRAAARTSTSIHRAEPPPPGSRPRRRLDRQLRDRAAIHVPQAVRRSCRTCLAPEDERCVASNLVRRSNRLSKRAIDLCTRQRADDRRSDRAIDEGLFDRPTTRRRPRITVSAGLASEEARGKSCGVRHRRRGRPTA